MRLLSGASLSVGFPINCSGSNLPVVGYLSERDSFLERIFLLAAQLPVWVSIFLLTVIFPTRLLSRASLSVTIGFWCHDFGEWFSFLGNASLQGFWFSVWFSVFLFLIICLDFSPSVGGHQQKTNIMCAREHVSFSCFSFWGLAWAWSELGLLGHQKKQKKYARASGKI